MSARKSTTKTKAISPDSSPKLPDVIRKGSRYPIASLTAEKRAELLQTVLARALNDEKLEDIAEDLGVSRTSINQALLTHTEDQWKSVQTARALTELQSAENELISAPDILTVSRARERLRSAQWQLERLHRRLFGTDQPVSGGNAVQINIGIVRSTATGTEQIRYESAQVIDKTGQHD